MMRLPRFIPVLLAAMAVAGCESDPVTPNADIDTALAQMAGGGISTYTTAAVASSAGGVAIPVPATSASSCAYNGSTSFFVCAPVTTGGLTFSRQFQLIDAAGAPLSARNPLAIAAIRSVIDIEGTTTQGAANQVTVAIDRHEDATLSGIQSTNRVLNGSATQQLTITSAGLSLASSETSETSDLLLPHTAAQKYPLGGHIVTNGTMTLSSVTTSSQTYQREIAFDGTNLMTVKLTAGGATTTCQVNLASPGTPPNCG